jgi:hypothetical protein
MVAAVPARVGRAVLLSVVLGDLLTLGAEDAVRVKDAYQVIEARGIVGELPVELEDCVHRLGSR